MCLFGFSRGDYAARVLAGFIHAFGLTAGCHLFSPERPGLHSGRCADPYLAQGAQGCAFLLSTEPTRRPSFRSLAAWFISCDQAVKPLIRLLPSL
ncbi:phospholipase effector Tle1 domain-containing protein [Rhizobium sp. LjRoot258]|uniref:phospholipase effector Tle1 domain-containing protein n=1 Tax=Rhizobium sp. LjRoot258 TaxID=3342299 RepID=UPI003ECF67D2